MAQKYYARWPFHILTMAQSPGMVDSSVIEDNIARMILMSREEIDAKEAQEMLNAMGGKEWSDLMNVASDYQYSPEVQDYLTLHNIERHRLYPITEVLKDESEAELSEEDAEERMWDLLDEGSNHAPYDGRWTLHH